MNEDLNLDLRKDVIKMALTLEEAVNKLLLSYLNIDSPNLKALGSKNSSLSFKNKIDLLSDLEVLNKEEHLKFQLLMEFRNQFMHNIYCNSYENAVEILGKDRGKQLLKYDDLEFETDIEFKYKNAASKLNIDCLETAVKKLEAKTAQIEMKRKVVTDICDYSKHVIDQDTELIDKILAMCLPSEDPKDLREFKQNIFSTVKDFHKSMVTNDKFILLQQKMDVNDEKVKAFYK